MTRPPPDWRSQQQFGPPYAPGPTSPPPYPDGARPSAPSGAPLVALLVVTVLVAAVERLSPAAGYLNRIGQVLVAVALLLFAVLALVRVPYMRWPLLPVAVCGFALNALPALLNGSVRPLPVIPCLLWFVVPVLAFLPPMNRASQRRAPAMPGYR